MNSKSLSIGILSVTGVLLFLAQFMPIQPATAGVAVKDRDFAVVTAKSQQGGDIFYLADNRTGTIAVFAWDNGTRSLKIRAVGALSDALK